MTSPFPKVQSTDPRVGHLSIIYGRGLFEMQGGTQPAAKIYCAKQLTFPETYIGAPVNDQIRPGVYDKYGFYNTDADRLYGAFNWEDTDFKRGYKVQVVSVNPRTKAIDVTQDLTSFYGVTNATDPNFYISLIGVTESRVWITNGGGTTFTDTVLLGLNAHTLAIEVNINLTDEGVINVNILNDNYFIGNNNVIEIIGISTYNVYPGAATNFIQYSFIGYFSNVNEFWCTFNTNFSPPFNSSTSIGDNLIVKFVMISPGNFDAGTYVVPVSGLDNYIRVNTAEKIIKHPTENKLLFGCIKNNYSGAVEIDISAAPSILASYGFNITANPGQNFMYSNFNYFSDSAVMAAFQGLINDSYQQNGGDGNYRSAEFLRGVTSQVPSKTYSASPWGTQLATTSFVNHRDILNNGVYVPNLITNQVPTRNISPPEIVTPIDISAGLPFLTPEFTIPVNQVVWFSFVLPANLSLKITPALPALMPPNTPTITPSLDPNYYLGMTPEYWCTMVLYNSVGQVVGFNGTYNQQPIASAYDTGHWPVSLESTYPPGTYYLGVSGAGIYFENNTFCDQEFAFTAAGVYGDTLMRLRFMFYNPAVPAPPPPPAPVVDFIATPLTGSEPLEVAFTDLSTNSPYAWEWDFENNGSVDSVSQNPTHIYPAAGIYSVKLTAFNESGSGSETKIAYITVLANVCCWIQSEILPSTLNLFHFNEVAGSTTFLDSAQPLRIVTNTDFATTDEIDFCQNSLALVSTSEGSSLELSENYVGILTGETYEISVYSRGFPTGFPIQDLPLFEITLRTDDAEPLHNAILQGHLVSGFYNPPGIIFRDPANNILAYKILPPFEWTQVAITYDNVSNFLTIYANGITIYSSNMNWLWQSFAPADPTPANFTLVQAGVGQVLIDEYRRSNQILYTDFTYDILYNLAQCVVPPTCSYSQSFIDECATNLWHFDNQIGSFIYDSLAPGTYSEIFGSASLSTNYVFCGSCLFNGLGGRLELSLAPYVGLPIKGVTYEFSILRNTDFTELGGTVDLFRAGLFEYNGEGSAALYGFLYIDGLNGPTLKIAKGFVDPPIVNIPLPFETWSIISVSFDFDDIAEDYPFGVYVDGVRIFSGILRDYFSWTNVDRFIGSYTLYTGNNIYFDEFRRSKVHRYSTPTYNTQSTIACSPAPGTPLAAFTQMAHSYDAKPPQENPATYSFSDLSQYDPTSWAWDFGDGSPIDTTQNPTHTYTAPGTYDITLTVTNIFGSTTKFKPNEVFVSPQPTQPAFGWTVTDGFPVTPAVPVYLFPPSIYWDTPGTGQFISYRTATVLSGKVYSEFVYSFTQSFRSFGVGEVPLNAFYNSPNSVSIFSNGNTGSPGVGGCGFTSGSGYFLGTTETDNASYYFQFGDIIGIAYDVATRKIWFSKNGVYISGNPTAGTGQTAIVPGSGSVYFITGLYTCPPFSGSQQVGIRPGGNDQIYGPPSGFLRYQTS